MILGIDEVGRGPWAGPLVVGAVVLGDVSISGLADSKKLSAKRRVELSALIHEQAAGVGLGWVHAAEIDSIGLSAALRLATRRAVEAIQVPYHEIIIDGTVNFLAGTSKEAYVSVLPKADGLIASVSAASIIAKVARDAWMEDQDALYPEYGFGRHVGYGTAAHRSALGAHGVTPLHRRSVAPIARLLGGSISDEPAHRSTTAIGSLHETAVISWLQDCGHQIIARNWRTKWCEIDCVSSYEGCLYFTEVRYRRSTDQGGAIASITPKKLTQMRFAAASFLAGQPPETSAVLQVAAVDVRGTVSLLTVE